MADELLRLYAERRRPPGDVLPPADDDYRAFEATFPFDETADQARAIDDVNKDLESPRPMDRLVCGDVGFGKTEVALRAAFRVAMSGKQVASCARRRCSRSSTSGRSRRACAGLPRGHPALSRFQSKKEQEEAVVGLKDGKVDVVIGTHRLLSKDVHFKTSGCSSSTKSSASASRTRSASSSCAHRSTCSR
jgi:transcription-repair coupling factor (superfamily II helicase)